MIYKYEEAACGCGYSFINYKEQFSSLPGGVVVLQSSACRAPPILVAVDFPVITRLFMVENIYQG